MLNLLIKLILKSENAKCNETYQCEKCTYAMRRDMQENKNK